MTARSVIAVAVALVAGCPGSTGKDAEEPKAANTRVATRGARDLMKEIYATIKRGGTDGLLGLVDPALVTVGPGAETIFTERSAALVAFAGALPPGEKYKVTSTDLHVVASPAGHAAWASDVVEIGSKRYSIGVIMTEADELWTVAAIQIGVPIARKDVSRKVPAPTPVPPPATGADGTLAKLFKDAALDPMTVADQLAASGDVVVRDIEGKATVGRKAIKKAWKKEMKGVTTALHDDTLHARVVPDGTLGYVIGAIDVTGGKKEPTLATRVFHVYEKAGDTWQLVLAQPAVMPR